jgi:hypothetical protein
VYKFKLLALNECGAGPFSNVETAKTYSCPLAPSVAVTSRVAANLKVSWEDDYARKNRNFKSKVTGYKILFEKKDGSTTESKVYCNGFDSKIAKARECEIPLLPIERNTRLALGDLIRVKIKSFN